MKRECVSYAEYQLGSRKGALLRLETGSGIGYADCHPWPELGDSPLVSQLDGLREGALTPLLECALAFAKMDASARAEQRSLFKGLSIPESHWLIFSVTETLSQEIEEGRARGFTIFKLKLGNDVKRELREVNRLKLCPGEKLRFDFNAKYNERDLSFFLDNLSLSVPKSIDFLEDPLPYHRDVWSALRERFCFRLALDRELTFERVHEVDVVVIKPAIDPWREIIDAARKAHKEIVVTSYLGHPFGNLTAAYVAACAYRDAPELLSTCGLYSEALTVKGNRLLSPGGTGFGFDQFLQQLDWRAL